ncbi:MAG TPA: polysaccharide deacetylase family protein [Acidobacteriaceae bacterium]|nr:polysaccharide deacetylase family protein [Acidobacteriaceae bacterium]
MSHTVGMSSGSPFESTVPAQPVQKLWFLYHELRSSKSTYSYATDIALFQRHVELYIALRQAPQASLWPEITFDDGHISNIELAAPILQAHALLATFFITVGWTGKKPGYMGWPELRSLHQAGHSIGAHGWTHTLLTHCDNRQLQLELRDARVALEQNLGTSITTMSLPGGRYNGRIIRACEEAGYTEIFSSIPRAEALPTGTTIGRLNILGDMEPEWMMKLFHPDGRLLADLNKQYRRKQAAKRILGDKLYERLWALVNRHEHESPQAEDAAR